MKTALILLALTFSANTFAEATANAAAASTFLPTFLTSAGDGFKMAQLVLNDAQEYYQTGAILPSLEASISNVLASNPELSVEEAIDVVIANADQILK